MSSSKYLLVAGARPNFMKIAPIHKAFSSLRNSHFFADLLFVHTGQHYSQSMSDDSADFVVHDPAWSCHVGASASCWATWW